MLDLIILLCSCSLVYLFGSGFVWPYLKAVKYKYHCVQHHNFIAKCLQEIIKEKEYAFQRVNILLDIKKIVNEIYKGTYWQNPVTIIAQDKETNLKIGFNLSRNLRYKENKIAFKNALSDELIRLAIQIEIKKIEDLVSKKIDELE